LVDPFVNLPYYIGFAKNPKRPYTHLKEYNAWMNKRKLGKHPNYWKLSRIRDIIASSGAYVVEIVFESQDPDLAYAKEQELIKQYGRLDLGTGTLTNMTDGGKGFINPGPELSSRISAIQRRPLHERLGVDKAEIVKQSLRDYAQTPTAKLIARESGLKGAQHVIDNGWSDEAIAKRVATRKAKNSYNQTMNACQTPEAIYKRNKKKFAKIVMKIIEHYRMPITSELLNRAKKERVSSLNILTVQKYYSEEELGEMFSLAQHCSVI
jgi:hypothetical protein